MWGDSVNGVRLVAVTERDVIPAGRPVIVQLRVENTGAPSLVVLTATHPLIDYDIGLTGPAGAVVAMTPAGKEAVEFLQSGDRFRRARIQLGLNEVYEEVLTLSEWFDVSRPGRYALTIARADYQDAQGKRPTVGPVEFAVA